MRGWLSFGLGSDTGGFTHLLHILLGVGHQGVELQAHLLGHRELGVAALAFAAELLLQGEHRLRPDGSGYNSFPSGHTASAFAAAEFLRQEYRDISPWYGYAGYFVATATGTLRMYNNKHWFSDVVAGAGFGIASTKISYLVYPYIKRLFMPKKQSGLTFFPYFQDGTKGLMVYGRF